MKYKTILAPGAPWYSQPITRKPNYKKKQLNWIDFSFIKWLVKNDINHENTFIYKDQK